jgi:hypothetical protein
VGCSEVPWVGPGALHVFEDGGAAENGCGCCCWRRRRLLLHGDAAAAGTGAARSESCVSIFAAFCCRCLLLMSESTRLHRFRCLARATAGPCKSGRGGCRPVAAVRSLRPRTVPR